MQPAAELSNLHGLSPEAFLVEDMLPHYSLTSVETTHMIHMHLSVPSNLHTIRPPSNA